MKFKLTEEVVKYLPELKTYIESTKPNGLYNNQRTVGDLFEKLSIEFFKSKGCDVKLPASNRTIEDFTLNGELVDVKSHAIDKKFSMPQIISFKRLEKHLISVKEKKIIRNLFELVIEYSIINGKIKVHNIMFDSFFNLDINHIEIYNLGNGLIELKRKNGIVYKFTDNNIEEFISILEKKYISFCEKQILKFQKEIQTRQQYEI